MGMLGRDRKRHRTSSGERTARRRRNRPSSRGGRIGPRRRARCGPGLSTQRLGWWRNRRFVKQRSDRARRPKGYYSRKFSYWKRRRAKLLALGIFLRFRHRNGCPGQRSRFDVRPERERGQGGASACGIVPEARCLPRRSRLRQMGGSGKMDARRSCKSKRLGRAAHAGARKRRGGGRVETSSFAR